MTPAARSRAISASLLPRRPRSPSSVCSPSGGGASRYSIRVTEKRMGLATPGSLPAAEWSSSIRMPRALTCGSWNTCATSLIGPFGTPAASSSSTHSRVLRRMKTCSSSRVSSARFSTRLPLLAKRGSSGDPNPPAHALDHEVVARPLAPGAALAEAGERAVDEPRVSLPQGVVAQAVAGEIAVLVVLDQDIEAVRERTDQRLPLGDRDVHRDRLLAAIRRGEIGGVAGLATVAVLDPRRPESARVVAALRPLHLDDLGPEIRQVLPGPGAAHTPRQVQDADVRQRACHASSLREMERAAV